METQFLRVQKALECDKCIAATATNRRVEIHRRDSPTLSLPLQYPAAIGLILKNLIVVDVFGQVNCWG